VYFFFFFPVGTDSRKIHPPVGTVALLLAMLVLYALRHVAPSAYVSLVMHSFLPARPTVSSAFLSLFLHGSWMHLAGNALYLWIFGRQLEGRLGFVPLAVVFGAGGVASCWCQAWLSDPASAYTPLVGASGAVAAILGATVVRFRYARVRVLYFLLALLGGVTKGGVVHLNTVLACAAWFGLQLAWGFAASEGGTTGVAYAAHGGGFVAGFVLAFLLGMHRGARHDVYRERARRYLERGDFHAAVGELTRHLRQVPEDGEAAAMRARGFAVLGRSGEAASEYQRLFRDARRRRDAVEGARLYREMRRYGVGSNLSESGLLRMAFDFHKAGRSEAAAEVFLELTTRFPAGPKAELALVRRAEICWNDLGSYELAADSYRRLIREYPESEWRELADARLRSMRALSGRTIREPTPLRGSPMSARPGSAGRASSS